MIDLLSLIFSLILVLIIPSVFASSSLNIKTNLFLIFITVLSIIFLTFFHQELPKPLNQWIFNIYYYYAVPIALIIALIFLNFFAITFGKESRLRKEALDKIQEVIAKEHELVSLGGQAAAAAHSLGTPLSTIKIISQDLSQELKDRKDLKKDLDLLVSQINRCNTILKKLTLSPVIDEFIDKEISLFNYLDQIIKSFEDISSKKFEFNYEQNYNSINVKKSIELVYGLRNFIGNANKFAKNKIFITLKSNSEKTEILIEDDGEGFPKDILGKIGDPYIKSIKQKNDKAGLGLGIFIGKTLLEKNRAKLILRNSETRPGGEVYIHWLNKDLRKI